MKWFRITFIQLITKGYAFSSLSLEKGITLGCHNKKITLVCHYRNVYISLLSEKDVQLIVSLQRNVCHYKIM